MNDKVQTAPPIRYGEIAPRFPEGEASLEQLLPGKGDFEIELGYGRGAFLLDRAEVAKDSRIIGIEIKKKLAFFVEKRRNDRGLSNARVFGDDARVVLPRITDDGGVARFFIHFPDPWWKKRHAHRRILDDVLLDQLARLLRSKGELFVQTDVEERAQSMVETLRGRKEFTLAGDERGFVPTNTYGARSNREARADEDGLPVYRILAIRT
ncbi:MAG: tRNA (guanosine(46)-N7)-methyltransferase TrmB [Sandaracinaceae bacterium]|nr:tRNA (guanosine(46)-N7)-methyltransferase TrmB [Sandaracinaceae bacterium]